MKAAIDFIYSKIGSFEPEIGIVLGSGLSFDGLSQIIAEFSFEEIPGFKKSSVQGHRGKIIFALLGDKKLMIMQGRLHYYEGHNIVDVIFPIKLMKALNVKTLILTNAAGAVNENYKPSDLMLIKDHINFMGTNPLIGPNDLSLGTRFPDMSEVYSERLRKIVKEIMPDIKEGVYLASTGPSYETPAEIRMFRTLGADAVGMSTVPEAIVANYCSMEVLGISTITNMGAGLSKTPLNHQEVVEAGQIIKEKFKNLLLRIIDKL